MSQVNVTPESSSSGSGIGAGTVALIIGMVLLLLVLVAGFAARHGFTAGAGWGSRTTIERSIERR